VEYRPAVRCLPCDHNQYPVRYHTRRYSLRPKLRLEMTGCYCSRYGKLGGYFWTSSYTFGAQKCNL